MKINSSLKMILVLVIVSCISGASLALVYEHTQPLIMAKQSKKETIFKVLPQAKTYKLLQKDGEEIYIAEDQTARVVGYAVIAKGAGYQGEITLMAGFGPKLEKILNIEILESVETPGLGGMIESHDFKDQFKDLAIMPQIDLVRKLPKRPNEIQAITGATISSNAVIKMLNDKIETVRKLLKDIE